MSVAINGRPGCLAVECRSMGICISLQPHYISGGTSTWTSHGQGVEWGWIVRGVSERLMGESADRVMQSSDLST